MEQKPEKTPAPKPDQPQQPQQPAPRRGFNINLLLLVILLALLGLFLFSGTDRSEISYQFFLDQLEGVKKDGADEAESNIAKVTFYGNEGLGEFKEAPHAPKVYKDGEYVQPKTDGSPKKLSKKFVVQLPPWLGDESREKLFENLNQKKVIWDSQPPPDNTGTLLLLGLLVPIGLFFLLWMVLRRTRDQLMGGGFLSGFSKSPAKKYEQAGKQITFDDVAGLEGVKADLQEIVEFLKSPEKFHRLGGEIPKGVLLNGPPGTGKTLLARAVAGEAGVPFFSISGSEFIQMFVGVGASRVRDLFQTAKQASPAIIFIDEIDAVGRQRGAGLGGGHDEREQTLNQILSEMDGFTPNEAVIIMAATNRPDVLDPALLRPGRFDRHVTVDRPTLKGRLGIFKVHVRDIPLADDVDLHRLAAGTVGMTGAEIHNVCNEAALWAARHDKSTVGMDDFEFARDKVLMGSRREEVLLDDREKEKTAYHEAGHALLGWLLEGTDPVHKVTVIPRGRSLGVTQTVPEEEKMNISESELADRLAFILGGRAAEKLVYDEISAGAENDLEQVTKLARRMITRWGMSERLGPVSYKLSGDDPFLGREIHESREFSEHTLQVIDEEVARVLHTASNRAFEVLSENRDKLDKLAEALTEREELTDDEITELIGPSIHEQNGRESKPQRGIVVHGATRDQSERS